MSDFDWLREYGVDVDALLVIGSNDGEGSQEAQAQDEAQGLREALASEQPEGDEEAEVGFPEVEDAAEVNRHALAEHGQSNHSLVRPEVLAGALGRAENHVAYTGDLPQAAAALCHGVAQGQAFEDGNKRTAYHLTRAFLEDNGMGAASPADFDDEELADHIIGYAEGTHTMEDTAALFRKRLGIKKDARPMQWCPDCSTSHNTSLTDSSSYCWNCKKVVDDEDLSDEDPMFKTGGILWDHYKEELKQNVLDKVDEAKHYVQQEVVKPLVHPIDFIMDKHMDQLGDLGEAEHELKRRYEDMDRDYPGWREKKASGFDESWAMGEGMEDFVEQVRKNREEQGVDPADAVEHVFDKHAEGEHALNLQGADDDEELLRRHDALGPHEHLGARTRMVYPTNCPSCESGNTLGRYQKGGWREYVCKDCGSEFKSQVAKESQAPRPKGLSDTCWYCYPPRVGGNEKGDGMLVDNVCNSCDRDYTDSKYAWCRGKVHKIDCHVAAQWNGSKVPPDAEESLNSHTKPCAKCGGYEKDSSVKHLIVEHGADPTSMDHTNSSPADIEWVHAQLHRTATSYVALYPETTGGSENYFTIHLNGCQAAEREHMQRGGTQDIFEHDDPKTVARAALDLDPDLEELGYDPSSYKVHNCVSKGLSPRVVDPDACAGTGMPWKNPTRRVRLNCPECGKNLGTGRGVVPKHKTAHDTEYDHVHDPEGDTAYAIEGLVDPEVHEYHTLQDDLEHKRKMWESGEVPDFLKIDDEDDGRYAHVGDDAAAHHTNADKLMEEHPYWADCQKCGGDGIEVGSTNVETGEQKQKPCSECKGLTQVHDMEYWDSDEQLHDFANYPAFREKKIPDKSLKEHMKADHGWDGKGDDEPYMAHQAQHGGVKVDPEIAGILLNNQKDTEKKGAKRAGEITYERTPHVYGDPGGYTMWAHQGDKVVGQMNYFRGSHSRYRESYDPDDDSMTVHEVYVHPGHRRQGIGEGLFRKMQEMHPGVDHGVEYTNGDYFSVSDKGRKWINNLFPDDAESLNNWYHDDDPEEYKPGQGFEKERPTPRDKYPALYKELAKGYNQAKKFPEPFSEKVGHVDENGSVVHHGDDFSKWDADVDPDDLPPTQRRKERPEEWCDTCGGSGIGLDGVSVCPGCNGYGSPKVAVNRTRSWFLKEKEKVTAEAGGAQNLKAKTIHEFPDGSTVKHLESIGDAHYEGSLMKNCIKGVTSTGCTSCGGFGTEEGDGECGTCEGRGHHMKWNDAGDELVPDENCEDCLGSGKCKWCEGTGAEKHQMHNPIEHGVSSEDDYDDDENEWMDHHSDPQGSPKSAIYSLRDKDDIPQASFIMRPYKIHHSVTGYGEGAHDNLNWEINSAFGRTNTAIKPEHQAQIADFFKDFTKGVPGTHSVEFNNSYSDDGERDEEKGAAGHGPMSPEEAVHVTHKHDPEGGNIDPNCRACTQPELDLTNPDNSKYPKCNHCGSKNTTNDYQGSPYCWDCDTWHDGERLRDRFRAGSAGDTTDPTRVTQTPDFLPPTPRGKDPWQDMGDNGLPLHNPGLKHKLKREFITDEMYVGPTEVNSPGNGLMSEAHETPFGEHVHNPLDEDEITCDVCEGSGESAEAGDLPHSPTCGMRRSEECDCGVFEDSLCPACDGDGHRRIAATMKQCMECGSMKNYGPFQVECPHCGGKLETTRDRDKRVQQRESVKRTRAWYLAQQAKVTEEAGEKNLKAKVVHKFGDGWTIKHLKTIGDAHYEGSLMKNCIKDISKNNCSECGGSLHERGSGMCDGCNGSGKDLDKATYNDDFTGITKDSPDCTDCGGSTRCFNCDGKGFSPLPMKQDIAMGIMRDDGDDEDDEEWLHPDTNEGAIYSLRDPDDIPQTSFVMRPSHGVSAMRLDSMYGRANTMPKTEHVARVAEFFKATTDKINKTLPEKVRPDHTIEVGYEEHTPDGALHTFGEHDMQDETDWDTKNCKECLEEIKDRHFNDAHDDTPEYNLNCPQCQAGEEPGVTPRRRRVASRYEKLAQSWDTADSYTRNPDHNVPPSNQGQPRRPYDPWNDEGDSGQAVTPPPPGISVRDWKALPPSRKKDHERTVDAPHDVMKMEQVVGRAGYEWVGEFTKEALFDYDPFRDVSPSGESAPAPSAQGQGGDPWPDQGDNGTAPPRPGYIFDPKLKKWIQQEQLTYPGSGVTFPGVTDINKVGVGVTDNWCREHGTVPDTECPKCKQVVNQTGPTFVTRPPLVPGRGTPGPGNTGPRNRVGSGGEEDKALTAEIERQKTEQRSRSHDPNMPMWLNERRMCGCPTCRDTIKTGDKGDVGAYNWVRWTEDREDGQYMVTAASCPKHKREKKDELPGFDSIRTHGVKQCYFCGKSGLANEVKLAQAVPQQPADHDADNGIDGPLDRPKKNLDKALRAIIDGQEVAPDNAQWNVSIDNQNKTGAVHDMNVLQEHLVRDHYQDPEAVTNEQLYNDGELEELHIYDHANGNNTHNPEVLKVAKAPKVK